MKRVRHRGECQNTCNAVADNPCSRRTEMLCSPPIHSLPRIATRVGNTTMLAPRSEHKRAGNEARSRSQVFFNIHLQEVAVSGFGGRQSESLLKREINNSEVEGFYFYFVGLFLCARRWPHKPCLHCTEEVNRNLKRNKREDVLGVRPSKVGHSTAKTRSTCRSSNAESFDKEKVMISQYKRCHQSHASRGLAK